MLFYLAHKPVCVFFSNKLPQSFDDILALKTPAVLLQTLRPALPQSKYPFKDTSRTSFIKADSFHTCIFGARPRFFGGGN